MFNKHSIISGEDPDRKKYAFLFLNMKNQLKFDVTALNLTL